MDLFANDTKFEKLKFCVITMLQASDRADYEKRALVPNTYIESPDQPVQSRSLIRAFMVRVQND